MTGWKIVRVPATGAWNSPPSRGTMVDVAFDPVQSGVMQVKLLVVGGEVKTKEVRLRLPTVIGRGEGATLLLPHPLVSRKHCELFEAHGRLVVRDLSSLNGTYVNNEKITESVIEPGELLTVGSVTFRAVYEIAPEDSTAAHPVPQLPPTESSPRKSPLPTKVPAKTERVAPQGSPGKAASPKSAAPAKPPAPKMEEPEPDHEPLPPNPDANETEESGDYGLAPPGDDASSPLADEAPADAETSEKDGPDDDDLTNFLRNLKR